MAKLEWNLQWEIGANVSWVHSLSPDMQIKKLEHATEWITPFSSAAVLFYICGLH